MSDDNRLARIRKLLAQAEDPACTPAEAEAFTAKAADLMARYGIDEALLAQSDPGRDPMGDRVVDLLAPYGYEKAWLGAELADALRCRSVIKKARLAGNSTFSLHLFGHASDLTLVEILLTSLLVQGSRDLARAGVPWDEHPGAYRRSWWLGFGHAVGDRLREAEAQAAAAAEERFAAQGTSAALVLADRAALAEQAMRAAYDDLRTAPRRRLSGGGMGEGYAAGQRADLGRGPRVSGGSRAALGGA